MIGSLPKKAYKLQNRKKIVTVVTGVRWWLIYKETHAFKEYIFTYI